MALKNYTKEMRPQTREKHTNAASYIILVREFLSRGTVLWCARLRQLSVGLGSGLTAPVGPPLYD